MTPMKYLLVWLNFHMPTYEISANKDKASRSGMFHHNCDSSSDIISDKNFLPSGNSPLGQNSVQKDLKVHTKM